jgi:hypothetical protein
MAKGFMGFTDGALEEDRGDGPGSWVHFPPRSVGRICLLADRAFAFLTHWDRGITHFCWGPGNCPWHADRLGFKGHYVFPVYDTARRSHGAFDFTKPAYKDLLEMFAADGLGIRKGRIVHCRKEGGVDNGRHLLELTNQVLNWQELGPECDVLALVARTYKLDVEQLKEHVDVL